MYSLYKIVQIKYLTFSSTDTYQQQRQEHTLDDVHTTLVAFHSQISVSNGLRTHVIMASTKWEFNWSKQCCVEWAEQYNNNYERERESTVSSRCQQRWLGWSFLFFCFLSFYRWPFPLGVSFILYLIGSNLIQSDCNSVCCRYAKAIIRCALVMVGGCKRKWNTIYGRGRHDTSLDWGAHALRHSP